METKYSKEKTEPHITYTPCYIQLFELFINKIKIWKQKK